MTLEDVTGLIGSWPERGTIAPFKACALPSDCCPEHKTFPSFGVEAGGFNDRTWRDTDPPPEIFEGLKSNLPLLFSKSPSTC